MSHPPQEGSNRSLPSWTLLAVLWQMCHVWITYRTSSGSVLMMDKLSRKYQKSTTWHASGSLMTGCWGIPSRSESRGEEKDSLDSELANTMMETAAQVQLGPGTQNPKELTNKASFTGGSKECAKNSRVAKKDMVNEGYTRGMFKEDPIDRFLNPRDHSSQLKSKTCI